MAAPDTGEFRQEGQEGQEGIASRVPRRRAWLLGCVLLVILVIGWAGALGCGASAPAPATAAAWPGDTHATAAARAGAGPSGSAGDRSSSAPVRSWTGLAQAALSAALDDALRDGRHEDAVVLATRVRAGGGTLSARQDDAVYAAVDALAPARLRPVWQALDDTRAPAHRVALRLALWAAHVGDDDAARAWVTRLHGPLMALTAADRVAAERADALSETLSLRAPGARAEPFVLAVLLPLSGRYGQLGRIIRVAVELAVDGARADIEVVFLDTAGDADRAEGLVDQAVEVHRALAILGPVGAEVSRRAAARASRWGVPIGLLAPADEPGAGADASQGVFRLWSSAAWEARQAARWALTLGHTRLAVLAPRDEHGRRAAEIFAREAETQGGEIVQRGEYDPTGRGLEADVKAFLGLDPRSNLRLRRFLRRHGRERGWRRFSPDVEFELLYIPDEHDRAMLVAAYLPYFNVELRTREFMDAVQLRRKHGGRVPQVVQLLGSSGWHHPGLAATAEPAVEGALVIDVYAGADEALGAETAAGFSDRFAARVGRPPGRLAAQAHDAAALMVQAYESVRPQATPAALRRALAGARITDGACGPAWVEAGQITREGLLLRVDGGGFVPHEF